MDPELLDKLIGWDKVSVLTAKKRIIDSAFLWATNIEKYIPIANHRPSRKDTRSIIRAIQESREI